MKYKESISKSTKGWKERLFSRNTSVSNIGSEVRREVNAGIASVSRMEFLGARDNDGRGGRPSTTHQIEDSLVTEPHNSAIVENTNVSNHPNKSNSSISCAASQVRINWSCTTQRSCMFSAFILKEAIYKSMPIYPYMALKYVSFPVQTLAKCAKMIPVMVWATIIMQKIYKGPGCFVVVLVTLGGAIFILYPVLVKLEEKENRL